MEAHNCIYRDALDSLNQLRLSNTGCDVIFEIGAKSFPAHRAMLMARVEHFRSMFTADMREKKELTVQFDPQIIDPDFFGEVLNYIYTLKIDFTNENIRAIYKTADYFCFDELTTKAKEHMKNSLCVENVILYWNISVEFNLESFEADCKQLLIVSSSAISIKNQLIPTFSLEDLQDFTDALKENEKYEDMFEYLIDWVLYDKGNRNGMLLKLLKNIPVKSLPFQFVKRKMLNLKSASDSDWLELLFDTLELTGSDDDSQSETLYAIGGCDGKELSSVSRYNSATRRWTVTTPMLSRRTHFGFAVIDYKIYVCGGYDAGKEMNSLIVFDTDTQIWTQLTPMKHPRQLPGVAALNGQIYAAGGSKGTDRLTMVERYNVQTNRWQNIAPMTTKRSALELVALNGFLYAIGGHDGRDALNSVERYDPQTDQWTKMNNTIHKNQAFGSAVLNGKIYIVGNDKCEVYSAADDKWTKIPELSKCDHGRRLAVYNGKLYAIGGLVGQLKMWKGSKTVAVFDFQARVWRQEPDMDVARCFHQLAVVKS